MWSRQREIIAIQKGVVERTAWKTLKGIRLNGIVNKKNVVNPTKLLQMSQLLCFLGTSQIDYSFFLTKNHEAIVRKTLLNSEYSHKVTPRSSSCDKITFPQLFMPAYPNKAKLIKINKL